MAALWSASAPVDALISLRQLIVVVVQSRAVADMTWAEGRRKADERLSDLWRVQGQSYVRVTAEDYGFSAQAAE